MEDMILREEMKSFRNKTNSCIHCKDTDRDEEAMELLGLHERSDFLPTMEEVVGSFPYSSCRHGTESNLSSTGKPIARTSAVMGSTLAPKGPTAPVVCPFYSNCESHVRLKTDLGSDKGATHVIGNDTNAVTQAPETLPVLSAAFSEWDRVTGSEENEDVLAAEDWLSVAEALDPVNESEPVSVCDQYSTVRS